MNMISGYLRQAGTAIRFLLLATIVLGLLYPLAVFGAGQLAAPFQANGSIVKDSSGQAAASALIVQAAADDAGTQDPQWFHVTALRGGLGPGNVLGQQPGAQRRQTPGDRNRQPRNSGGIGGRQP